MRDTLFTTNTQASPHPPAHIDDPALHGGRQRTFKHVDGNWPTHVFITVPMDTKLLGLIEAAQTAAAGMFGFTHTTDMKADSDNSSSDHSAGKLFRPVAAVHVSLSREIALRQHEIQPFVAALREEVQALKLYVRCWILCVSYVVLSSCCGCAAAPSR